MISYELAKKLKDAGFPFLLLPFELFHQKERAIETLNGIEIDSEFYRIPLLSELIEAIGENFWQLLRYTVGFWACSYPLGILAKPIICNGMTPKKP
ncbi:MAG: hypothetical protein V4438_04410 [Patescibacteria group bacterium]